jgi:peptidoglycan hydrolase CwlO-like protein
MNPEIKDVYEENKELKAIVSELQRELSIAKNKIDDLTYLIRGHAQSY